MRLKTTLSLVASALLLASCGGGESTTSTPAIDPLTLGLNLTGKSDNELTVTSDTQLTSYFWGQDYVVGVLKPDNSVAITVTPALIATMPKINFQKWKDTRGSCDVSKLLITKDAEYFSMGDLRLTVGGKKYVLAAGIEPQTSGTVTSFDEREYFYAKGAAEVSGTITCDTSTYTYAYSFKPGWNLVAVKYSYDIATQKHSTYVRTTLGQGNVQTADFVTYEITQ